MCKTGGNTPPERFRPPGTQTTLEPKQGELKILLKNTLTFFSKYQLSLFPEQILFCVENLAQKLKNLDVHVLGLVDGTQIFTYQFMPQ